LALAVLVVAACLLSTLLLARSMRSRLGVLLALVVVLVPICFLRSKLPGRLDLYCILSPALRLEHGFGPRDVYLQYDLLPSLLALGWSKAGGAPFGITSVVAAGYYVMLLGLFVIARKLFGRASLAAPLLVSVVVARVYAIIGDASAVPQVTPIRLELWLLLLAAVLAFGLEHWLVGVALGVLCLFSRSMGMLYLGAYGLGLSVEFFARRHALAVEARLPLFEDVRQSIARIAPAAGCVAVFLGAARWLFGNFSSDALTLYRQLGIGFLRIAPGSFYWWLLPLTGAVGCLVFSRRGALPERRGQAVIFALALVVINSFYFFGSSHEANLTNLGTSFLLCFFLALDLCWPSLPDDPRPLVWAFRAAPWLVVSTCAYFYSERIVQKVGAQAALLRSHQPLILGVSPDAIPRAQCKEITRAAGDARVFFVSMSDFLYYHDCGFEPQGYVQPVYLNILKAPLTLEMNRLLDDGYKTVVPRYRLDWGKAFDELRPELLGTDVVQTPNFRVFRRRSASSIGQPATPGRDRVSATQSLPGSPPAPR